MHASAVAVLHQFGAFRGEVFGSCVFSRVISSVSKPGSSLILAVSSVAVGKFLVSVFCAQHALCAFAGPWSRGSRFNGTAGCSVSQWVGWDVSVRRLFPVWGRYGAGNLVFCSCCVHGAYGCRVAEVTVSSRQSYEFAFAIMNLGWVAPAIRGVVEVRVSPRRS